MDLQTIPDDLLRVRGMYSTVNAAHKDQLHRLSELTGRLSAYGSQILRFMQPSGGHESPCDVSNILKDARLTIDAIEICAANINELAAQKAELLPTAWPKGK